MHSGLSDNKVIVERWETKKWTSYALIPTKIPCERGKHKGDIIY